MQMFSQFTFGKDAIVETVDERSHFWHYSPDITKKAEIIMVKVILPVGGKHDFHSHPKMNEILFILNGQAEQWIENEKRILLPGDSVYMDKCVVHATFNIGKEPLEFLAVLTPIDGWEAGTIDESLNFPYKNYRN